MNSDDTAITVENLAKCYRIGSKEELHDSFARTIIEFIKSPWKNYRKYRSLYKFEDFSANGNANTSENHSDIIWALRNVSFEVERGDVVGIIGRNGAGKSTLLKILSKITVPTSGRAVIRGRISSLLEVGTGFHQELTGRENVYLNGTVLGMSKREVDRKFDEIVDFSGVEKFIDTPVKRYSSGMKVRLAFSVAAHLEPETLLIDEVLAVGDAVFQKKCLGKMGEVAREGRTVLFVSHDMGAITELCRRTLWFEYGQIIQSGSSSEVVSAYLSAGSKGRGSWHNEDTSRSSGEVHIRSVRLLSQDNQSTSVVNFDEQFKIEITYDVYEPLRDLSVTFHLYNAMGITVLESMDTDLPDLRGRVREPGRYSAVCTVVGALLKPGTYHVSVVAFIERIRIFERHEGVLTFEISEAGYTLNPGRVGVVYPVLPWELSRSGLAQKLDT